MPGQNQTTEKSQGLEGVKSCFQIQLLAVQSLLIKGSGTQSVMHFELRKTKFSMQLNNRQDR